MFCFAFAGGRGLSGSSALSSNKEIITIAQSQIGIREVTGNNDGVMVETYLAVAGLKKGEPWCAAFLSWIFKKAGYAQPSTGWSPALFPSQRLVKLPAAGLLFGIYFPSLKRIGHCGLIENVNGNWLSCVEGNTNINGSRDGDGVYRKLRHTKTIHRYSDWITNNLKRKE
jgi:hypothetical protein